jgi:hypothetical protein
MRIVFILLVAANVAFFGYAYLAGDPATREPAALERQIAPEKLKLLSAEEAAARIRAANRICIEWGALLVADAALAEAGLAELAQGARITQRRVEEPNGWWVYIPPLASRQAGAQRVAELKKRGIDDVALMPDDSKFRNAVSLGIFSTEEAAIRRQEALVKKGVKDAQMVAREPIPKVYLQLRGAPDGARTQMIELKGDFPGSEVHDCPRETPRDAKGG